MLKILRKKNVAKRIYIISAAIIIPAFVLWGTGSMGKKEIGGKTYVGIINGKKVLIDEFISAKKEAQIQVLLNYMGQKEMLDKVMSDKSLINKLTWDRLVLISEANKKHLDVSDKDVVTFITTQPLFLQQGAFDRKFYDYIVTRNLGVSTRTFEEALRDSLKINKLKDIILADVTCTDDDVSKAYRKDNEKGKVSYLLVNKEDIQKNLQVKDAEIEKFYQENKARFTMPERVNLEYIDFPYLNLSEKDYLKAIVKDIFAKVKKDPAKFADIARENNREVQETGEFAKNMPAQKFNIDKTAIDKVFSMNAGDIEIISDNSLAGSVYIVRMKQKSPQEIKTKEAMKGLIEMMIKNDMSEKQAKTKADELFASTEKDKVSLEDLAAKNGLKVTGTDFIKRTDYVENVGEAQAILEAVFAAQPKQSLGPFQTRKGYIIARLDQLQPIDEAKYKEEKETYRQKVLSDKKMKAFEDWFDKTSQTTKPVIDLNLL